MQKDSPEAQIVEIYSTLFRAWGRQHWWPARTRFEVIVGAYLTQNTSWTNVELAMKKLRAARMLTVAGIRKVSVPELENLIRSSGYFRQKAQRLKTFVNFLDRNYRGSLTRMFHRPTSQLRKELLSLNGVGRETADSILLYAGQHSIFVVDAYTKRIAARHAIVREEADYEQLRTLFESSLAASQTLPYSASSLGPAAHKPSRMSLANREPLAQIFNDMHGLIVGVGKQYCVKSNPRCNECPLRYLLPERD